MTELIAKPVLKNKYWIVEDSGNKIATIQAVEGGGFVYVNGDSRTSFSTVKVLSKEYNITFTKTSSKEKEKQTPEIYNYPITNKAWNVMWDVKHHFGVYTKSKKSKSFFCAGYYLIKFNNGWVKSFCPKLITLKRYSFQGPFKTKEELNLASKIENEN